MRNSTFSNNEFYHLYCRGAGKRSIFYDDTDAIRFLKSLLLLNNINTLPIGKLRETYWRNPKKAKQQLVNVISFVLMNNHYHLVLEQLVDDGIAKFMQRLGTSYTKYLAKRHGHMGVIFGSAFKSVRIETDAQFLHITRYLHLNPIDHIAYQWRIGETQQLKAIKKYLRTYRWSSFRHFIGLEKNPIIDNRSIADCFNSPQDYENFVLNWTNRNTENPIHGLMIDDE